MKNSRAILILVLLLSVTFTLGTALQPRTWNWKNHSESNQSVMALLFGDSRRMFANQFFVQADATFHSGYYPSIFDQARQDEEQENAVAHSDEPQQGESAKEQPANKTENGREAEAGGFLNKPADWIERFGRHFMVTEHTHLSGKHIREILPWLKLSADMDPHRIDTYTVASYWLRKDLDEAGEAEQFLRQGLRANPDSYEILFELGRLYDENYHDETRARNVWKLALRRWREMELKQKEPYYKRYDDILMHLGNLEREQGNYAEAIHYFEMAKEHSPAAAAIQEQINELRTKLANPANSH